MKKVAIYARVSTTDKGQDVDTQLIPLKEYVERRGWEIFNIYIDEMSGSKENRPSLNQLMKDGYKKKYDCVLVFRFDRFARSTKQLINALETFNSLGIDFVSYQEAIDTTTPAGQMMFTMIAGFATFERRIIQERVKAGLIKARAKGRKLGRPKANIDIEKLKELKTQGYSIRKIATTLGIPKSTVQNHL